MGKRVLRIAVGAAALLVSSVWAQQNVGIGTNTPHPTALLELYSTSKGLLIPRMTQAERDAISSPATGLLIYQTDNTPGFYYWNGTAWIPLLSSSSGSGLFWSLTGNSITGTEFLGTTNAQPLVIQVGNQETFRFNPPGASAPAWSIQRGGGNQRGLHAVDLQSARSAATQVASGDYSVIGGGTDNTASGGYATVGGGRSNTANNAYATVGGGYINAANSPFATVGGGQGNTASGNFATVGGGIANTASGNFATVGGGYSNTASGDYSAIPGGAFLQVGTRSFGFSGQTTETPTDLSANSNIAAFVDVDLWLYSRDFTSASQLRLYEAQAHSNGAEYVAFQAPNTLTTSTTYTLPADLTTTNTVAIGILQTDASGNLSWLNPAALVTGSAWALTGNSGTNPAVNFLGTTDAQPLVIRTNNTERMRVTASGDVGIGTTTPLEAVEVVREGVSPAYVSTSYANANFAGAFVGRRARGTMSAPAAVQSGDALVFVGARGYDGTAFTSASRAFIRMDASENWTPTAQGTRIWFATTANGTTSTAERVVIQSSGDVEVKGGNVLLQNSDNTARQLRLYEPSGAGANFTAFQAQAQASDIIYTLPASLTPTSTVGAGILQTDASGNLSWLTPSALVTGSAWALTGNAITAAWDGTTGNFLGTTNAQPLVIATTNTTTPQPIQIWVGNQETFRFNPPGASAPAWSIQRGGGDPRGLHAVDLQSARSAATQVASGDYSVIGGGQNNTASGDYATVGGGGKNTASGSFATVGGGYANTASGDYATVGGGSDNTASGDAATVGGGYGSLASSDYATVGGGSDNTASGDYATVGGGSDNTASGDYATVGGGSGNTASGGYATVGGGSSSTASGKYATVGGGGGNTASGGYATVGGGERNTASGDYATVGGGERNTASGDYATVGGGDHNTASGLVATVGGGGWNTASGQYATVGGGFQNTASGDYSAIPGGYYLRVGNRSFGFSGQTSATQTDLSANSNIAAFVDVDLWLYSRDRTQASQLRFYEAQAHGSGANYVALRAPTSLSANTTYTLPASDGSPGQVLTTDGSGQLSWSWNSGGTIFVRKTSNESVTNITTPQADDHLYATLPANSIWEVEILLRTQSAGGDANNGGIQVQLNAPTGTSMQVFVEIRKGGSGSDLSHHWHYGWITAPNTPVGYNPIPGTTTQTGAVKLKGLVIVGSTGGTLQLYWAQNAANGNATTVYANSYMKLTRIQ
jgi:hypothetical protein